MCCPSFEAVSKAWSSSSIVLGHSVLLPRAAAML